MTNDSENGNEMATNTDPPNNVIALSKYRARLGRGRRMRRADALMSQPHPEQAIQALPGDELYYLLREEDPQEAKELLAYVKAEQLQVVLDFGLWSGDQLMVERMEEWVEVMAEMPFETIGEWIRGLDIEMVALMIRKGARIYDLEIEDPPDEPAGTFYSTPDRFFVLDAVGYRTGAEIPYGSDGEHERGDGDESVSARAIIRVVDALYRADMVLARRILVGAKAELDSGLEEMALRWRQGRMADLGFIDSIEALEIYKELDPATVRIGELRPGTRVRPIGVDEDPPDLLRAPGALGEHLTGPSLFARALSRVTSPVESEELHFGLVGLTNRVLAAERIDAADDAAIVVALGRMRATLDLAVEFLARVPGGGIDEDRAVDAVRTVALFRLFRLGVSLIGKVRALARALTRRGPFAALSHLDLLEEPEATVLAAVTRARPLYSLLLDDQPKTGERPFGSLADVARATVAIERAAVAQAMLLGLGVRPEHLLPEALEDVTPTDAMAIDTGVLARTALVLLLQAESKSPALGKTAARVPAFRPLTPDELAPFAPETSKPPGAPAKRPRGTTNRPPALPPPPSLNALDISRAKRLLEKVAPPRMEVAAHEMTARWLATLSPLEPVLLRSKPRRKR